MKNYILWAVLSIGILSTPAFTQAAALTTAQSTSLIAVVQSSPGTPASAFVNLITAFSNITVNQATSLIAVIQASPNTPATAFVDLLTSFTVDTLATPATNQSVTPTATLQSASSAPTQVSTPATSTTTPSTIPQTTMPTSSSTTTLLTPTPILQNQPTNIVQDGFDTYNNETLQGQGGWSSYVNGLNFVVVDTEVFGGTKAIYNQTKADSVITKTGSLLPDGKQAVYVKSVNRASWGVHSDGNAQVRVSKNPWASGTAIFAAVSFKGDGNVAYYNSVENKYKNFAVYEDGVWTLLEIEWRSSDKTARYRINDGSWTDWYTFTNASAFTGFDNVGFDFDLRDGYGGGVYFDSLQ